MITRRQTLAGGLAAATFATTGAALAQQKLKVGFVYVGPVSDHGWSYEHDQGRKIMEKELAGRVESSFVENVPEGADAERVMAQLAQSGHGLIFTTSFGYMNPTLKVAERFPRVKFEHATGYTRSANVATYAARFYEGRTVVGLIAGKMTKSGIIGYVGSYPIPEVVSGINAFTLALRSQRPDAQVRVVWVNSWYDPGKEASAAKALIDQGADVILQHTDSPAAVQVAQERGVWAVGQSSDMSRFGPKAHLTAIVDEWGGYYTARAKAVLDGTWQSIDTWGGLDSGMVKISPYNTAIPKEVVDLAEDARKGIIAKTRHPFQGPFKDQSGKEIVPAGKSLDDPAILSMNYYVEGVQGQVPK
jgi:simple sugar transport system substrate-binding protein